MGVVDELKDERVETMKKKRFGLYRGIVRDVNDAENLGRIRAEVPEVLGAGKLTPWASYCAPFGGSGAGFFMLPEPGDGVWLMFERGEPTKPVWLGYWYNENDKPPKNAGTDVRVLQSKSGHVITFGDTNGSEFLEVADAHGNRVRFDTPNGKLTIEVSGAALIKAGGSVTVDAPRVTTTKATRLAGGGRRVARVGDVIVSRGHKRQVGRIRTGAANTTAN